MFTEAQNLAITKTELDTVFFQNFMNYDTGPNQMTADTGSIFRKVTTAHSAYIGQVNKGVSLFSIIGETQTVPLSTPRVANKYTVIIKDFAQGIEISKDLYDDNMHGVWAAEVRDMAIKARISQTDNAMKVFRNAFTTQITPDGVSWINATHPLIGGGTTSNLITGALSPTTFNNAIIALRQQKDQAGVVMGGNPKYLVVSSANFTNATQITQSALVSNTGNNAINVFRSAYGIEIWTSPYLDAVAGGSDTAWFLLSEYHGIIRVVRQDIETALRSWELSNNRSYFYQANFREEVFVEDYSGSVGSTGL